MKEYEHNYSETAKVDFPIVGIGASAGGLEALIAFLSNVPENSGWAFVIVQHMEQTRKGIMAELLQSVTTMKVFQVEENTSIQPDCVYVIPPNQEMSIQHRMLHLFDLNPYLHSGYNSSLNTLI